MRTLFASLLVLGALLTSNDAHAQGALALRNPAEFRESKPFTWTIGANGGYDRLQYKSDDVTGENIDSYFIQGGVGLIASDADKQTPWNLGLDAGAIHYLDEAPGYDDTYYNARVAFNIVHEASKRLKFANDFYLAYEVEPDYSIGASTALRNGQYLYGYENIAVSYAWSERFSTVTQYTIDGIRYDDEIVAASEDRLSHLISQQFSYALDRQSQLVGEYRFRITNYDQASSNDFTSHYALAGIDHAWSERTTGTLRLGAEFYESDRVSETSPYGEIGINHATSKKTTLHLYGSAGFDGAELSGYNSRYSYRTGITANHRVTERFSVNGGLHYINSDFEGDGEVTEDVNEQQINATAGLAYRLWNNVSMDAQYSYTLLNSDDELREYDRNRVSLGLSAEF